ncbi:MAG: GNAT family N-acetyltransferase [Cyclobacteriaceae bacterium]|jgi:RimJ/RimL family protein N-acetyltransferase|nr:GNAT family N-acetyltransferase [Cyclobacteriaceae bacterium]
MKYLLNGYETERLRFRLVQLQDAQAWLSFVSTPEAIKFLGLKPEDTPEERCRKWFVRVEERYANDLGGFNALVSKLTGEFVGMAGLLVQEVDGITELEVSYSIMPEHWHKGYASEAARLCRDVAFQQNYAASLISIIHPENVASQRVAIQNGMHLSKHAMFREMPVLIYQMDYSNWQYNKSNHLND